jgi:hypothetical protein
MLGFSIQKLLVLAGIVAAVWYGFKFVSRLQEVRDAEAKAASQKKRAGFADHMRDWVAGRKGGDAGGEAEDLIQCPRCGAYVAARGATSCGRSDCPY